MTPGSPEARQALVELLGDLFDDDELRMFLRSGPAGEEVRRALPGTAESPAAVADRAVDVLERRGLVSTALFERLRGVRPLRTRDIDHVASILGVRERGTSGLAGGAADAVATRAMRVFVSYSHEDEAHRLSLERCLSMLRRQGLVECWHDRMIAAGDEWRVQISEHLEQADIILLLLSVDFIASDYCWDVEMTRAMARHAAGSARVIPIFVRDCDWSGAPFSKLQGVPDPKCPIARSANADQAWTEVARAIRAAVHRPPDRPGN